MPPANAGFETGALTPWIPYQGGPTGGVTVTATGHSGSYSLMQSPNQAPNNPDEAAFQDIYGLTPGQSYRPSKIGHIQGRALQQSYGS